MKKTYLAIILLLITCMNCNEEQMATDNLKKSIDTHVSAAVWENLATKKIYFGHQSVGFNIINGVEALQKEHATTTLNIIETDDPAAFAKDGIFAHSRVGENDNPTSKMRDFEKKIIAGIGDKADYAFMKFCYVDVIKSTNVQKLFDDYVNAVTSLSKAYPSTQIVHLTVPLHQRQSGVKARLKTLLGRPPMNNLQRNAYNSLLREKYAGKEPLFDLAKIESTYPNGKHQTHVVNGVSVNTLIPHYTNDGGHLNELGQKVVASRLLRFLASISTAQPSD